MRILVVASTFPVSETDSVPAFVRDQIVHMRQVDQNLDFHVLAPHYDSQTSSYKKHQYFTEYRFSYFWPAKYQKLAGHGIMPALGENKWYYFLVPILFIGEFLALFRLARKIKPDVIYAHWFTPQGINASIISLFTGIPYAYTTHAADVEVWRKIPLGGIVVRFFSKRAYGITAVSQRSLGKLKQFFGRKQWHKLNTEIIPMGVNLSSFNTSRKTPEKLKREYGLENQKVLFFVGRLAEKKGVTYLLQAFAELYDKHPDLHLIIAGDGQFRPKLEAEAEQLGINDKTLFTGYIAGQKKSDYFHLSDILVLPSTITKNGDAEGLPVVLMEGLAAGKLCVATHVSGADDILSNQENGFLVNDQDVPSLVDAVTKIMSMSFEEKLAISQNAQKLAQTLDWHQIVQRHYEFLFQE